MEFALDGRLFVAQQSGHLRVIKNGSLLPADFVTLSVASNSERGLLGIAFDPNFASNGFVYVYYTRSASPIKNRVSRFTASASNPDVAQANSELVILDNIASDAGNHNGGAIHFGLDGKLYVAVGDGGSNASNSQSLGTLSGKLLRINSNGTIPSDNPFVATAGARGEIWALGLRNPYTFAGDPLTGKIHINDVGQSSWEEINLAIKGANYGWPTCEGMNCGSNPNFTNPIYTYSHSVGQAITGGAFYRAGRFPAQYDGSYFFADYLGGWIKRLDMNNQVTDFWNPQNGPVDLKVGLDGALYYLSIFNASVYKIDITSTNRPPTASFNATPASGAPPLSVSFNAGSSSDSDGDALTYSWDFGDGSPAGTGASASHVYQAGGSFIAKLIVNDGRGGTGAASRTIAVSTAGGGAFSAVHVNFQPAGPAVPGYLVDSGLVFGPRGNNQTYGWNISIASGARNRNNPLSPDERYDTLIHMGNAVWEFGLPNGTYAVRVVVGDPNFADVVSRLTVEGALVINGNTSNSNRWFETAMKVSVNDGRLTIGNLAGSYNKICFIDILDPASDITAPVISGTSAAGVTSGSATILWTTNEPSNSQVEYGTTADYGTSTTLNSSQVTSHSEAVSGLAADTTYHFRVKSRDAAGNLVMSGDQVFKTAATGAPPTHVNINFQPDGPAFPGYLLDSGLAFAARGNGQTYGWNVSVAAEVRSRGNALSPDQRYDTLIHMGNAVWEIALPNGTYTVHVVVGDPSFADVVSKLTVEGVLAVNGTTSSSNRWLQATVTVSVNDGKLTVGNLAGSYNKICYIDISTP